jgi:protocatechuate 3,4-dioxygenase beta subunit
MAAVEDPKLVEAGPVAQTEAEHQDEQIGRVLSRREILALLGLAGGGALAGCAGGSEAVPTAGATGPSGMLAPTGPQATAAGLGGSGAAASPPATAASETLATAADEAIAALPRCIVRPAQGAGPFFADRQLERSDIRADQASGAISEGRPLLLEFYVSRVDGAACAPLAGFHVDVWHCDAQGAYSAFDDGRQDSRGADFLRGYQVTDASGLARFRTIYPGWYPGRAVHIHFKIRSAPDAAPGYDFTSQLYFDDAVSDRVLTQPPYAQHDGNRTRNTDGGGYGSRGEELLAELRESDDGYVARFDVGLQLG